MAASHNHTRKTRHLLDLTTTLQSRCATFIADLVATLPACDQTLDALETMLLPKLWALSQEILSATMTQQAHTIAPATAPVVCACGQRLPPRLRSATILTRLGKVTFQRTYGACPTCRTGTAPADTVLGIVAGSTSAALDRELAVLGATHASFAAASATLRRLTGITVSPTTVQRATTTVGMALHAAQATAVQQATALLTTPAAPPPPPPTPVPTLYISMDGVFAPIRPAQAAECKIGCISHTRTRPAVPATATTPARAATIRVIAPSYCVGWDGAASFGEVLWAEAVRRGVLHATDIVVLGDGAAWIWHLATQYFPTAIQIVDWYHATTYLAAAATAIWGETPTPARTTWLETSTADLWESRTDAVLAALATHMGAHEDVLRAHTYLTNQRERLDYARYRALGLQIGSGSIESAAKRVIVQRLDGSGMHWSRAGADVVSLVRAWWLSDRWAEVPDVQQGRTRAHPKRQARPIPSVDTPAQPPPPARPAARTLPSKPRPAIPAAVHAQIRTELAQERADHPWRKWQRPGVPPPRMAPSG